MAKVSVIMNCFNSGLYLKRAIDSIYAQTYDNWDIIFWDNQSTDNSAQIAKGYDKKLHYYYDPDHKPLGEARNLAMDKAKNEYIAFLDCDDEWSPEKLEKQINILDQHQEIGLVYSNFQIIDHPLNKEYVAHKTSQPSGNIFAEMLHEYTIGILTVCMRRSVLDSLECAFDPYLNLVEDYDLFMRIIHTAKAYYVPEILALYNNRKDNHTNTYRDQFPREMLYSLDKLETLDKEEKNHKEINKVRRIYRVKQLFFDTYKRHIIIFIIKAIFQFNQFNLIALLRYVRLKHRIKKMKSKSEK